MTVSVGTATPALAAAPVEALIALMERGGHLGKIGVAL